MLHHAMRSVMHYGMQCNAPWIALRDAQAPIFHVNGDDVEAVARVCRLAAKYRKKFHKVGGGSGVEW